ncbi:hypothetical protein RE9431_12270 [Prescottella equi]|nr:hypothetical protein RE9414_12470 [Prescottella equi]BCN47889.1 hypothetical protein RE9416_11900 [Prescottella equi]BCN52956.1 hypothetical protein RE9425_13460 [Prescottella equi]BCN62772.1 hypothetical protein RE9431_12270 [Prescottella equi]BCN67733.1 hypothetical protein RE943_12060 [Prescottella equi]
MTRRAVSVRAQSGRTAAPTLPSRVGASDASGLGPRERTEYFGMPSDATAGCEEPAGAFLGGPICLWMSPELWRKWFGGG